MSHDLRDQQLDSGAPARARPRREQARRSAIAAVAVILVTLGASAVLAPESEEQDLLPVSEVPLHLSALDRTVPLDPVSADATRAEDLDPPGRGSLVATAERYEVYLAQTAGGDLCLWVVNDGYGSFGGGCHPQWWLLTHGD